MFYSFVQNNSGGVFHRDSARGIGEIVYVEAVSPAEANKRAVSLGLYFGGVVAGIDCGCCGDRWMQTTEYDGEEALPTKESLKEYLAVTESRDVFVHLDTGEIVRVV